MIAHDSCGCGDNIIFYFVFFDGKNEMKNLSLPSTDYRIVSECRKPDFEKWVAQTNIKNTQNGFQIQILVAGRLVDVAEK